MLSIGFCAKCDVPDIVLCSVGVGIAAVLVCVIGCMVSMRFVRFGQLPTPAPASSAFSTFAIF